ncbi:MAG: hypothetical protein GXP29_12450 [Planctomycetes bacterium]|nr:hypothetical protein [Planctomycetota bacterium]
MNKNRTASFVTIAAALLLVGCAQTSESRWAGTWKSVGGGPGGKLECSVRQVEGERWNATFTGYCNREFAYKVQMEGRQKKKSIFFQGQANLGEGDGIYTWTGQIAGGKFIGNYTGAKGKKAGSFAMSKQR